jgi:hypothetical protein
LALQNFFEQTCFFLKFWVFFIDAWRCLVHNVYSSNVKNDVTLLFKLRITFLLKYLLKTQLVDSHRVSPKLVHLTLLFLKLSRWLPFETMATLGVATLWPALFAQKLRSFYRHWIFFGLRLHYL